MTRLCCCLERSTNGNQAKTSTGTLLSSPTLEKSQDEDLIKRLRTVLLLGGTESGKSTVLKQMRLRYGSAFGADKNSNELVYFRKIIRENIWSIVSQIFAGLARLDLTEPVNPLTINTFVHFNLIHIIRMAWT